MLIGDRDGYWDIDYSSLRKEGGVYLITGVGGRNYVGSGGNIRARVEKHFEDMSKQRHPIKEMNEDYKNNGLLAFKFYALAYCSSELERVLEGYYIKKYDCIKNGYNSNNAGIETKYDELDKYEELYKGGVIVTGEIDILTDRCKEEIFEFNNETQIMRWDYFLKEIQIMVSEDLSNQGILNLIDTLNLDIYIKSVIAERLFYKVDVSELKYLFKNMINFCHELILMEFNDTERLDLNNIFIELPYYKNKELYNSKIENMNNIIKHKLESKQRQLRDLDEKYIELSRRCNIRYDYLIRDENLEDLLKLRRDLINSIKRRVESSELKYKTISNRYENINSSTSKLKNSFISMNKIIDLNSKKSRF